MSEISPNPGLNLDPFAAKIHWHQQQGSETAWPELTRAFVEIIARQVQAAGAVIGHIKGFASLGEHALRVNCVSARQPVDVEGSLPAEAREMTINLVVLAYGLDWNESKAVVAAAIEQVGPAHGCSAHFEAVRQPHAHHHDHSAR